MTTAPLFDMVKMTVSGTPGTGTITLGNAIAGFQSFLEAGATDGVTVSYSLADVNNVWEVGHGTYHSSGPTLSRGPLFSSNGNAAVSLSSTAQVWCALLAEDVAPWTITDGVHTVASVTQLTVSGGTVSGTTPDATLTISATSPGGTSGQIQYDNGGSFGGFTASGDATINTGTGAVTLATVNSNVGSYTSANITVDAKGRVTAAANGSGGGGSLTVTDGVHTVTGATQLTFSGATVSGTTPNATATISGGSGVVQSTGKISVSSAQLLACGVTPVTLIAAPGSGMMIRVLSFSVELIFNSTAYTDTGFVTLYYGSGSGVSADSVNATSNALTAGASSVGVGVSFPVNPTNNLENLPIVLSDNGGTLTLGDGTAAFTLTYVVDTL